MANVNNIVDYIEEQLDNARRSFSQTEIKAVFQMEDKAAQRGILGDIVLEDVHFSVVILSVSTLTQRSMYGHRHGTVRVSGARHNEPSYDAGMLNFDIAQISVSPPRKGYGTFLIKALLRAALRLGRGVFMACPMTDAFKAWSQKLVEMRLFMSYETREYPSDCFLSNVLSTRLQFTITTTEGFHGMFGVPDLVYHNIGSRSFQKEELQLAKKMLDKALSLPESDTMYMDSVKQVWDENVMGTEFIETMTYWYSQVMKKLNSISEFPQLKWLSLMVRCGMANASNDLRDRIVLVTNNAMTLQLQKIDGHCADNYRARRFNKVLSDIFAVERENELIGAVLLYFESVQRKGLQMFDVYPAHVYFSPLPTLQAGCSMQLDELKAITEIPFRTIHDEVESIFDSHHADGFQLMAEAGRNGKPHVLCDWPGKKQLLYRSEYGNTTGVRSSNIIRGQRIGNYHEDIVAVARLIQKDAQKSLENAEEAKQRHNEVELPGKNKKQKC